MAESLVIIEAPGKRRPVGCALACVMRGFEVLATAGHIATNPARSRRCASQAAFVRRVTRFVRIRRAACERIREAAQNTTGHIYLATDDDRAEGDVIARDVWWMVIAPEDRARVLRVRLRALSPSEVQSAFVAATALIHFLLPRAMRAAF